MNEMPTKARDYSETLFLPKTDFPMRAGLPQKEPEILAALAGASIFTAACAPPAKAGRASSSMTARPTPTATSMPGTALNKILKDVVTKSQQMLGFDSNYVPGWDCHGLPIEWKIEEENYRAKGKPKPDLSNPAALIEFRRECRAFAEHWIGVQRDEFSRLGVIGDWAHPYTTMDFFAEAQIARELMKFAANGTLYRGSKPVMWSVVEKTALAEAEVEYEDYTSDTVWVKFPIVAAQSGGTSARKAEKSATARASDASIVIWTTTPWTIPGNRAISYSPKIEYGLYEIVDAPAENWAKPGDLFVLADKIGDRCVSASARDGVQETERPSQRKNWRDLSVQHPLKGFGGGYAFQVPLLAGDHVTDDTGTGFVHTAPGHGREDFDIWTANARELGGARHQHRHSLYRRCRRPFHRAGAGLYRQARPHRQGREG